MSSVRTNRQAKILELIRERNIGTQEELCELLNAADYAVTQATVSRDITDMGLVKSQSGGYSLPEDIHLSRMLCDMVTDVRRARNLVVIHSSSGTAQGVAAAIDGCALPGILGSIAGDDTILVVVKPESAAPAVEMRMKVLSGTAGGTAVC